MRVQQNRNVGAAGGDRRLHVLWPASTLRQSTRHPGAATSRYNRQHDDDYDRDQGPDIDVGFFYGELSPYGEWVRHPHYGWVWFPRHVRAGWRPYSLGRWMESDYGWTWVSDEPFGWATYHYGRWTWDPWVGWLWVPGTDWGPAWVAWQHGNGYVGWAPLPPQVGFELGVGIRLGGFSLSFGIAPRDYSFVEERRFLHPDIGGYIHAAGTQRHDHQPHHEHHQLHRCQQPGDQPRRADRAHRAGDRHESTASPRRRRGQARAARACNAT